jgi:GT2 family glycosyltransferase
VNWNSAAETLKCLDSLEALSPPLAAIHVVDNASKDDSVGAIARAHPRARIHLNPANAGFAGGVNPGLRAALGAGADWVLLLNNDATLQPDAVSRLLGAARERPDAGLLGGKIYRDRAAKILWCCGVDLGFGPNVGRLRGFGRKDDGRWDETETVDSLTGCGLLVRRAVFEKVGLLDESYFAYVEDADFALRAAEAGFRCVYEPTAVFEHKGGGSTGGGYSVGRKYLTAHGAARFLRRHGAFRLWANFIVFDVLLWPLLFVVACLKGERKAAVAKLKGTIDGFLSRPPDLSLLQKRS